MITPSVLAVHKADGASTREGQGPIADKPAHWGNKQGTLFDNPWDSWRDASAGDIFGMFAHSFREMKSPPSSEVVRHFPIRVPDFGASFQDSHPAEIKATWLGHACFLIEFPREPDQDRGIRILVDPVFSNRCSPFSFMGPSRFTPAPCQAADIPEIDVLVLSHNHYDHMDLPTLKALASKPESSHVRIVVPLNNAHHLASTGFASKQITELDWWESADVDIGSGKGVIRIGAKPAQHMTARGISDRKKSLWASFLFETRPSLEPSSPSGVKVYFTGDTGYSALSPSADPDSHLTTDTPVCPAFREIGEKHGPIDLALVPVGAYRPRAFMSPLHCDPWDAVRLFKDIKAKRAIAMHYGVWQLTTETIDEPVRLLAESRDRLGVTEEEFGTLEIGQTGVYPVGK
ncbi:Predicted Zn-dependent hydrolase (beta-lactamase superfamily) [Phaffia rhodozyma]|uniref:Predicted Zn-dependent hydrolase (Beta-lactamase superfamily) n=1 Tax=Phaffia rhodozyma TaxID=264483 RepID=A0A0F7SI23_PHARH|nr:Predicted Zn-dependent hydrolase (beta-lactamase superfamily) [Phaffia rhodozyma]